MNKVKLAIISAVALIGIATVTPNYVGASPASQIQSGINSVGGGNDVPLPTRIATIVNVILYVLGAIAVIMIIIGGVRYVLSAGESSQVKGAKDTILYAVIGLVVAILAYAIVNFVVKQFS